MRRLAVLWACCAVVGLSPSALAYIQWSGAPVDTNWNNPDNWTGGVVPTNDKAGVKTEPVGPIIAEGDIAVCPQLTLGGVSGGTITVDGGVFNVTQNSAIIGNAAGEHGTLIVNSGKVITGGNFFAGLAGDATVHLNGGTVSVATVFGIGERSTSTATVYLAESTVTCGTFRMDDSGGATVLMDIANGTLTVDANEVPQIQTYIDNGWIIAFGGAGTLELDYDVTNPDKTTLSAVHPLQPSPRNNALVPPGQVTLSWTSPDPCVPGQPVNVTVYFTDDLAALQEFTNPGAITVVDNKNVNSVVVHTQAKRWYYWAVDSYVGSPNDPVWGPIFKFYADKEPPAVDAGADVFTWLADDGLATPNLDATVTYDGAYSVQWTVISEPNDPNSPDAVIANPTAESTQITLSAIGDYVLQLDAFDGEYANADTITISVFSDSCEAAKSQPDWMPIPGDINSDCVVDQADLDILLENWLNCNDLEGCPDPVDPIFPDYE